MSEDIKNTAETLNEEIENKAQDNKSQSEENAAEEKSAKKEKSRDLKKENTKLSEKVAELEAKSKEDEDKYLRVVAEYENYRKRTQKEKEGIYADAYSDCITNLLPIADNLERALQFSDTDKVVEGVKMTLAALKEAFEKMGIKEIETEIFDPNVHNAVAHIDDDTLGEGVITDVFQKGYIKDGKVIRFAMVRVAN